MDAKSLLLVLLVIAGGVTSLGAAYGQQPVDDKIYHQRMQRAAKEASVGIERCRNHRVHNEFRTHAQFAACINQSMNVAYGRAGYRYPDLTEALNAKRLDIAGRLDRKQITEAEGNKELADFSAKMAKEEIAHDKARQLSPNPGGN